MSRRNIPPSIRAAVLDRDSHRCSNCGSTYNLTIDHIIPVAKGGTSNIENLRILCNHCNTSKGTRARPRPISSERYYVRPMKSVLPYIKEDWLTMTKDELMKALESYPEKLREALLRQHYADIKLRETRRVTNVPRHIRLDDPFLRERAKIARKVRDDPSSYNLPARPTDSSVETAVLASDEYAELVSKFKESPDDNTHVEDANMLEAREEKELADIEVEILKRTLETYRILADIMK